MSADRAVAFAATIRESALLQGMRTQDSMDLAGADRIEALLRAIGAAWADAEQGIPSEAEAQRWSRVCSAAERVVGL